MQFSHLEPDLREQAMRLRRRYRRFFRVDLVLHVLYALTAVFPAWMIIHHQKHMLFHGAGMIAILAVSALGILANLRLLHGKSGGFALGIAVTVLFPVTRAGLYAWVLFGVLKFNFDDWFQYHADINVVMIFLLTIYLLYRALYHISAYCHNRMFLGK